MKYISQVYDFSLSSFVKALIIINFSIWFFLVFVLQGLFLEQNHVFYIFGLTPERILSDFWLWQVFTYFFFHAKGIFHLLFNMFALWMFGSDLERLWGSRFFLAYYICCGVGAGLIYLLCVWLGSFFFSMDSQVLTVPMIGASGAIFGILFAYGLIFSERVIYFMMVFPMKALHFTLLIGFVEFVSLVNSGMGSPISHLAHLSGFVMGFLFLKIWKMLQKFNIRSWKNRPVHLKILRNDDKEDIDYH